MGGLDCWIGLLFRGKKSHNLTSARTVQIQIPAAGCQAWYSNGLHNASNKKDGYPQLVLVGAVTFIPVFVLDQMIPLSLKVQKFVESGMGSKKGNYPTNKHRGALFASGRILSAA